MDLLLIIDLQQAFINKNTQFLVAKIEKLVASKKYGAAIFARFINHNDSAWVRKLNYRGCIAEDSKKIIISINDNLVIDRCAYSAATDQLEKYIGDNKVNNVYLCGVDTESCVLKTALDLFEKGYNVYVLKDYCACTRGKKKHDSAIDMLRYNIGEEYVI